MMPFDPPPISPWPERTGTICGSLALAVCAVAAVMVLLGALALFGRAFLRAMGWSG